jgi:ribosome-binding protein aMBF1 (putative translation factor)
MSKGDMIMLMRNRNAKSLEEIRSHRGDPSATPEYIEERRALQFGRVVRALRRKAGLTQTELALRMDTTQPTIARLEAGIIKLTFDTLDGLATAIGKRK